LNWKVILMGTVKSCLRSLLCRLPLKKFTDVYFQAFNMKSENFNTYSNRTIVIKESSLTIPTLESQLKKSDIGIILQGPICHRQDFTYWTILRYLQCYPRAHVVLATWDTEKLGKIAKLDEDNPNLHVLQLEHPSFPGPSNINYQICSTKAGLAKVRELELEYAIKSRTDQCFHDVFALDKLRYTLNSFSRSGEISRIVFLSLNSFLFRVYGPSDMFQFGKTEQLVRYWDIQYDSRINWEPPQEGLSLRQYSMNEICEVYVCANYLRGLGYQLDFTMKQNLSFFRDLFILMDSTQVDLIWNKGTYMEKRFAVEEFPHKFQEWSFSLWNNLSQNSHILANYDEFLDQNLNS
jgi:hypothetical protein